MKSFLRLLYHYGAYFLGAVVVLVCAIALMLRFAIMPNIDRYKPGIETRASQALGMPVRIDAISADWRHLNPRLSLSGIALTPADRPPPLKLERIDATLSWLSLALLELRLERLDLYRPDLEIRRTKTGALEIAGILIDPDGEASPIPDWLLRQPVLTVSDGRLTWLDEQREAPPLELGQVNLLIRNLFGHHRLGFEARPPGELARQLTVRADLKGDSVRKPADWKGRIYLEARGASANGLNTWSPWAQTAVRRSTGDLRFWADLEAGQFRGVLGDVGLEQVVVSLADNLPDMTFDRITGRMGWRRVGSEQHYHVEHLRFAPTGGILGEPAGVRVAMTPDGQGKPVSARIEADNLRLEALTALTGSVPLPKAAHDWIARLNPKGFVDHVAIDWLGGRRFHGTARFRDGGMNGTGQLPGFSGLSGEIEADDARGHARLDSRNLRFDHEAIFRQPLDFEQLGADLHWQRTDSGGHWFQLDNARLGNADLDAEASGVLLWQPDQAPEIDLQARIVRGRGDAVWRYLPKQIADDAYRWLTRSIVGGQSRDTRLVLRGPLDRFPFQHGGGQFRITVPIHEGTLDYAPGWPRITGVEGLLTFENQAMRIIAERGDILGVGLSNVRGVIPDLHRGHDKTLTIEGRAHGPTPAFLEFIRNSPVDAHTGHFTETFRAEGQASLDLQLRLPLQHIESSRVAGQIVLADNRIRLDDNLPALEHVDGRLAFTESWLKGTGLSARLYDQPVKLNLASEPGGKVRGDIEGKLAAEFLRPWLPIPLRTRIDGTTAVQAQMRMHRKNIEFVVKSDLSGLSLDLPAPAGKKASQTLRAQVSVSKSEAQPALIKAELGPQIKGAMLVRGSHIERAGFTLGGQPASLPDSAGLTLQGNLSQLDLDAWRSLGGSAAGASVPLAIDRVNLAVNELKLMDRFFRDIQIRARPEQGGWHIGLTSADIAGEIEYGPRASAPGNRLQGRFDRLAIPDRPASSAKSTPSLGDLGELPAEVDVIIDALKIKERKLGRLALSFQVENTGLRIDTFSLNNQDAQLKVGGWLSASPLRPTRLDLDIDSPDLGQLLRRLGYVDAMKDGKLDANGHITWTGRLEDFALARLDGKLNLQIKNGRFIQLDPGAAKLLGILSLQALPRRITLDFRDVFSEGFAFDEIRGDIHLARGVGYLPNMRIDGPAAKVRMNGKVDLARENQSLRLSIQPRLDEGVAVGAALLGGPVAGVGALVASKILQDPLAKAASFEYQITGTWDEPVVKKLPRPVSEMPPVAP